MEFSVIIRKMPTLGAARPIDGRSLYSTAFIVNAMHQRSISLGKDCDFSVLKFSYELTIPNRIHFIACVYMYDDGYCGYLVLDM